MGWLWSSSPAESPKPPGSAQNQQPPPPSPPSQQPPSKPNDAIDPEIQKFFDLIKGETETPPKPQSSIPSEIPSSSPASSSSTSSQPSSSWFSMRASQQQSPTATDKPLDITPRDAVSEALLPTEMNCSQAFDLAWACNSLGGQWNAIYRYGEMRSCSELWDDFWFCMRTKSYTGELKESMIKARYREKEYRKYGSGKPSSEDIWEARTEKVAPGSCLNETYAPPAVDDDEWRTKENERRKQVRQALGLDKPS